jgi:hypothetical protein
MRTFIYILNGHPFFSLAFAALLAWSLSKRLQEPPLLAPLALGGIVLYAALALGYLCLPGFGVNSEVSVAAIAWNHQLGWPIYHRLDAPLATNMHYGPWLFLLEGWSLKLLGPSYFAAKLPAVLAALATLGLGWDLLRGLTDRRTALLLTGMLAWSALQTGEICMAARADAYILFGTALALWGAWRRSAWAAALCLGLALALLNGVKIHAALFALPGLVAQARRHGWKSLLAGCLLGLCLMALPFIALGVDFNAYMAELQLLSRHHLEEATLQQVLVFSLWLAVPLMAAAAWGVAGSGWFQVLWPLAPPLLAVLVLGSKEGSGTFHLLALLVPAAVAFVAMARTWSQWKPPLRWAFFTFMLSAAAVGGAQSLLAGRGVYQRIENPAVAEFAALRQALPGVSMAMGSRGDGNSTPQEYWANVYTWQRSLLTFSGMRLPIEEFAQFDLVHSGRPLPPALVDSILAGQPPVWLLPRLDGRMPFDSPELYDRAPMYEALKEHFSEQFRRVWRGGCFEVWVHNGIELSPAQKEALARLPQPAEAVYPSAWKR